MDQYGSFSNSENDIQEIRWALSKNGNICFAWSYNQIDGFIVLVNCNFMKLGTMPFGGNPDGRVYVSVYGKGCNHFSPEEHHPSYFAEKLNLDREAAEGFAQLWAGIWQNELKVWKKEPSK